MGACWSGDDIAEASTRMIEVIQERIDKYHADFQKACSTVMTYEAFIADEAINDIESIVKKGWGEY